VAQLGGELVISFESMDEAMSINALRRAVVLVLLVFLAIPLLTWYSDESVSSDFYLNVHHNNLSLSLSASSLLLETVPYLVSLTQTGQLTLKPFAI